MNHSRNSARISVTILRASVLGLLTVLLVACDKDQPSPEFALAPGASDRFLHHLVDAAPPGGDECCTDVLATGDINGDGYHDLVVGSENAGGAGLVWYEYPTWSRHDIAEGQFTTDGEAVDFDDDGDLDIVIGDTSSGIVWFEQTDARGWTRHRLAEGYAHDIVVADFDADGLLDVAVADKTAAYILRRQSGRPVERIDVSTRAGEGLAAADLDGDGDLDVLYSSRWIEQRTADGATRWVPHEIAPAWSADTRTLAADLNQDGRRDVVLAGSEGASTLAWFEAPADPSATGWQRHEISADSLTGAHSLALADFDLDGRQDVLVAEMSTSDTRRIEIHFRRGADAWERFPLASHGSHNMVVSDVDGDGDPDIVGKNYEGKSRFVEYWENRSADLRLVPQVQSSAGVASTWSYEPIDSDRPAADAHTFGLVFGDVDADGRQDVLTGGSLYLNPGAGGSDWERIEVAPGRDIVHVTPHLQNGWRMVVAVSPDAVEVLTADSSSGRTWTAQSLHGLPDGRTQGYFAAASASGSYPLYFTRGTTLFELFIDGGPPESWEFSEVWQGVQEEAVVARDIDVDGDVDLVAVDADGKRILWLASDGEGGWQPHRLGASLRWIDRLGVADMNRDGRLDIVFTEENQEPGYDTRVAWIEAPHDQEAGPWRPHTVAVLRSANSLDVVDVDRDGDADIIVAEHTDLRPGENAADNFTGIFLNRGDGTFTVETVEVGPHSSHLGARAAQLGGGPEYDIVSIGWEQSCCVHRWVNRQMISAAADAQR